MDIDSYLVEFFGMDREYELLEESNAFIQRMIFTDENKIMNDLENLDFPENPPISVEYQDNTDENLMDEGSDVPLDIDYPENVHINPVRLNLVPRENWIDQDYSLNDLVTQHFQKRSSSMVKFAHKLWNVLEITKAYPELYKFLGATWISDTLIKVNKNALAGTFGLKRPQASIFNTHGVFITHGFIEIAKDEIIFRNSNVRREIEDLDGIQVKVFEHSMNKFHQRMETNKIYKCKWINPPSTKKNKKKAKDQGLEKWT